MAQATIFVELDASGVETGVQKTVVLFNQLGQQIRSTTNTGFNIANKSGDELSKTLGRLSSSRAPQFMGALTSSVMASIPAFQGSAAAMGLMSTAAFSLQRALVGLVGSTGFVVLAVGALAALTISQISTGKSTKELSDEVNNLANRYQKLRDLGLDTAFAQEQLTKKIEELKNKIIDLAIEVELGKLGWFEWGGIIDRFTGANALFQLLGLSKTTEELREDLKTLMDDLKIFNKEQQNLSKPKAITLIDQRDLAQNLAKGNELWRQYINNIIDDYTNMGIETSKTDKRMLDTLVRGNELWRKYINDITDEYIKGVKERSEEEKKAAEKIRSENEARRQAQLQSIQQISSSFEDAFQQMLMGGKVAWDELLQYWITKLYASAIFGILTSLFTGGPITGFFGSLIGSQQSGTAFVSQTGPYMLHKGEAVIPAERNPFITNNTNNWGGNTYIIQIKQALDSKTIRTVLLPELKRMSEGRELNF